jgi:hypothetical protein
VKGRLGLAVLAAMLSAACLTPRALGRMQGLQAENLIKAPEVGRAIDNARALGGTMAGTLAICYALYAGLLTSQGAGGEKGGAGGHVRSFLYGLVAAAYVIGTVGNPRFGVDRWIREMGRSLGDTMKPSTTPLGEYLQATSLLSTNVKELARRVGLGEAVATTPEEMATAQAVAHWSMSLPGTALMVVNGTAIWFMAAILQSVHSWLVAFYTVLLPLVAPCLVLPWTRRIFYGWVRAYVSLCLWPMMFGICEIVVASVKWGAFLGVAQNARGASLGRLAEDIVAAQGALVTTNVLFLFVYLSVPVASYMLVNAAGRPFRGSL